MSRHLLSALAVLILVLPGLALFGSCSPATPDRRPKAAIIDQLSVLRPNPAFIEQVTADLEVAGFRVDIYQGDEVTVDFYRQLARSGYKLIVFRVHAGILGIGQGAELKITEGTWLFTNEVYDIARYPKEQLGKQLGQARIDEDYPWVFAIGSKFVRQSLKGEFPDTVIIMMGCSTLYLDDLAQAFIEKGTSAYFGWSATVDLTYVDEATANLVQRLVTDQLTVEASVAATMAAMGPDPAWGAVLRYYPAESGSQTTTELLK